MNSLVPKGTRLCTNDYIHLQGIYSCKITMIVNVYSNIIEESFLIKSREKLFYECLKNFWKCLWYVEIPTNKVCFNESFFKTRFFR